MADEYPRLLEDRDVVVIRDGHLEQTRLRGWLDGHDGPVRPTGSSWSPAWGATPARIPLRDRTCSRPLSARRQLEPDGLMVAVQGSRRDTYPSGMARDMGGGLQVYIMRPGLRGPPSAAPVPGHCREPARSASCARRRPPPRLTRPQDRQQRTPHWQSQASTSISATPPSEVPAIFGSHASCPKVRPHGPHWLRRQLTLCGRS